MGWERMRSDAAAVDLGETSDELAAEKKKNTTMRRRTMMVMTVADDCNCDSAGSVGDVVDEAVAGFADA
jgi:hypothetical protein